MAVWDGGAGDIAGIDRTGMLRDAVEATAVNQGGRVVKAERVVAKVGHFEVDRFSLPRRKGGGSYRWPRRCNRYREPENPVPQANGSLRRCHTRCRSRADLFWNQPDSIASTSSFCGCSVFQKGPSSGLAHWRSHFLRCRWCAQLGNRCSTQPCSRFNNLSK